MAMVRKQVYLETAQDEKVKRLARELGLTEAEIIRRAIDSLVEYRVGTAGPELAVRETATLVYGATKEVEAMEKNQKQAFDRRRLDHLAWEEELAFIESLAGRATAEDKPLKWNRDDAYDKRRLRLPD